MIHGQKAGGIFSYALSRTGHEIIADVLPAIGGEDKGLGPHELFEAALSACTGITLQMYARRKGIQLTDIKVDVTIVSEGANSVIERTIHLEGNLTQEEKTKLLDFAQKCPIHKLMESNIKVNTYEK